MRSIQELQQEDGGVKIIYFNLAIHVQCRDFKVAKTLFGVLLDDII